MDDEDLGLFLYQEHVNVVVSDYESAAQEIFQNLPKILKGTLDYITDIGPEPNLDEAALAIIAFRELFNPRR